MLNVCVRCVTPQLQLGSSGSSSGALTQDLHLADHQKMCYSALVLAMMFSMGEPLPYHHYGKSGLCLGLSGTAELM